jgi:hypothetical protein
MGLRAFVPFRSQLPDNVIDCATVSLSRELISAFDRAWRLRHFHGCSDRTPVRKQRLRTF